MTHALDAATAQLRDAAHRVATRGNPAEITTEPAQHPFAEGLLRAVPPTRQCHERVNADEHVGTTSNLRALIVQTVAMMRQARRARSWHDV